MTVYADLLANAKSFTSSSPTAQKLNLLAAKADPAADASAVAANAVHTIAQDATDHTGGTFALTVKLRGVPAFTTAAIAFDANAATIEGAIDTAATTASVPGWTNGDISVSGGILQAAGAPVVLTFDGTSVAATNHDLTVFDGALLTGGTEPATRVAKTTAGQTARNAWAALLALGVVSGSPPEQTAATSTTAVTAGANSKKIDPFLIRGLAREAAAEDANNAIYQSILLAIGQQDRAPRAELTGNNNNLG